MVYSIFDYGRMIKDPVRMKAYAEAIAASVRPGMTVLDLGTGTGIFALLACRAGARKVYAVDPAPAIQLGREIARSNGLAQRIVFLQARCSETDLPEPVDRIVSDMRGILPFFGTHLSDIIDARNRFLDRDGELIPRQDILYGALVAAPKQYGDHITPWSDTPMGFDMSPACRYLLHTWKKARTRSCRVVSPPCRWTAIDYAATEDTEGSGRLRWVVKRGVTAHGFLLWFDTVLTGSCGFSNAPGKSESIYGQAFFPFLEPMVLCKGEQVTVDLQAAGIGQEYTWRWRTAQFSKTGRQKRTFDQSTFYSALISMESLAQRKESYRPDLPISGKVDCVILKMIDGENTIGEIAEKIRARFPALYPTRRSALERVVSICDRYSGKAQKR